jgi:endonuclease-3
MSKKNSHTIAQKIYRLLNEHYPVATTFLSHETPFQLLIAVILSAQCTDERVNKTTPALFEKFPDCHTLAEGSVEEIQTLIKSINFCNAKATNIKATAIKIKNEFNAIVPQTIEELTTLPGVGRKTANVIIGQIFGMPGITVDTHVKRLTQRLGFTTQVDAEKIEKELMKKWPKNIWSDFSTRLIQHGRTICHARKPDCQNCLLNTMCPKIF